MSRGGFFAFWRALSKFGCQRFESRRAVLCPPLVVAFFFIAPLAQLAEAPVSEAGGSRFESEGGHQSADVAQLAEAPGRGPGGCEFESHRRHHPGSFAQLAEATVSKPVKVWVRIPEEPISRAIACASTCRGGTDFDQTEHFRFSRLSK